MGITIKTVNGDQVNEIKFDDCSYALKVFPLLTVLKYKIKDLYKEADVVCYYDGQSKLIQNERELSFPDGSTLIITFKRQVATNYVSTDDLDAQEYEIVSEKEDNAQKSVNVPVVVLDAIRKQVDKMDTFLKKVASEQHVNEEKYCKMELSKLIDAEEANDVCDPKEKDLEIAHCFEVYKRYKTLYYETKGQQINFSFDDYLDYILKNTDHQPIKVCSQAFVHLSQDYDTVTIDLVTTPGEFPTNHQLSVSTSNSNLFTINLSGFFPNTGGTKKFRYFPVTEDIKSKPLSVAISDKTTGRITMKGKSEGNSLPKLIRLSTVVDKIESSIDLDSIQEQTSKLYDEILKYETANKETSIISEDESAIKTESANWEEYDFLSDSSV